jgi:alkylation response protein AidB-like acyl-CoA dehydrogenase
MTDQIADHQSRSGTQLGSDELDDLCDGLRSFLLKEVAPRQTKIPTAFHEYFGPDGRYRQEILDLWTEVREASARAGFYTALAPASVGGGGLGFEALYRLWETLFETCGAEMWLGHQALGHWSRGPSHLYAEVAEEVRAAILPPLAAGTKTTCFAMSEPDAGSDIWRSRTTGTRVDGGWVLNGTKQWVTNSPYADWILVFAVTDREAFGRRKGGMTGFIVEKDASGFKVDSVIAMFGHSGGDEGILSFSDVFVPENHVIGKPGDGLRIAMSGISTGRMYNSARAVGLGRWALNKALLYAQERETFGRPLIENQAMSFPIAESAMELHAAYLMGLDAARALDAGREVRTRVSMCKAYSIETASRAIDHAVQVHGAMGFTNEMHLSEAWQQIRRTRVADGSSEIMRRNIVKHLVQHGLDW